MERLEMGMLALKEFVQANEHNIHLANRFIEWVRSDIETIETLRSLLLDNFDIAPYRTQPQGVVEMFQGVRRSVLKIFVRKASSLTLLHDMMKRIKDLLVEYSELSSGKMESGHRKLRNMEENWPKQVNKARLLVLHMEIVSNVDINAVTTALPKIENAIALLQETRTSLQSSITTLYSLIERDENLVWGAMPP